MQDGTAVPFRTGRHPHVHGVVTDRRSNPGEIGEGAHGSKQSVLLERMARLVAVSDVVHSFSSDQPRLRVDGRLSNRNVHEDRGESGRARLEQLVKRVGRHADGCPPPAAAAATSRVSPAPTSPNQRETVAGRLCDAVGGIMAAPRWSQASMLCLPTWEGTLHAECVRPTLTRAQ